MSLAGRVIFQEFLKKFHKSKLKWDDLPSLWTKKMLGSGSSRKKGDFGILGRIGQKYGFEVQAEWMRIDQIWYSQLDLGKDVRKGWWTEVAIEHENKQDLDGIIYLLNKLIEFKARLKLGICYPEDEMQALEGISKTLAGTPFSLENERYLFLFGRLGENDQQVLFNAWEFDSRGNRIKVPAT